jgi:hypothetical protein
MSTGSVLFRIAVKVDDSPPLSLTHSAEGDQLPAIGNPRAQGPEYGLRPSTGGVGFDVRRRFDGGHKATEIDIGGSTIRALAE